ncbi:hypothetical protein [Deinococcus budaensis]|uniref:Uncharacterized protein n=1 Tax=Deinococcus budaensis TaxID=1665626 RepID=A0A7W8GF73_9DEIO|nr:hypothetical protein [Deinococcus budaensis]MBB5234121.1 hypothetical protein [Deinococcus budaensis]
MTATDQAAQVYATYKVGLPVYTWRATLLVWCDRRVRLLEETVLRLVRDGVTGTDDMTRLLGLHDPAIVRRTVQDLLERGALNYGSTRTLHVTEVVGRRLLEVALVKDERRFEGISVWLDPLAESVSWPDEAGLFSERDVTDAGGTVIRPKETLGSGALPDQFRALHRLVNREPGPLATHPLGENVLKFELQHVLPSRPRLSYRLATLEVTRHPEGEWTYRLLQGGVEDVERSAALRAWELEGHPVVPVVEEPRQHPSLEVNALLDEVARAAAQGTEVIEAAEARVVLREAILAARSTVQVMPAVGDLEFTDDLPGWLDQALHDTPALKTMIGVDAGFLEGLGSASGRGGGQRLSQAYRKLRSKYVRGARVAPVNVRPAPCRVIVIDQARVLLQFREFQPYGSGKGLMRTVLVRDVPTALLGGLQEALKGIVTGQP